MRVLSVSSSLPYPPDDGTRIRTWHFLARLREVAEVTVVSWVAAGTDPAHIEAVKQAFPGAVLGDIAPSSARALSRARTRLTSLTKRLPPFVVERIATHTVPDLDDAFDVAVAEDDASLFLMPPVSCPVVVHRHNIFSDTIKDLLASGALGSARRAKWVSEMPTWERFDVLLTQMSDLSMVTTAEAAESLARKAPEAAVEVVGNGVVVPQVAITPGDDKRAVFTGVMNYEPNADAAIRFVKQVWPRIVEKVPGARFEVIGRGPLPQVRDLSSDTVTVTGEVPSIARSVEGATLGVLPLNAGSGIKNKTIELMAMGLPVVATPHAYEGIAADRESGMIRAEDDEALEAGVVELITDVDLARRMGAAAREFVASNFSWDRSAAQYVEVLRDLSSSRPRRGSA